MNRKFLLAPAAAGVMLVLAAGPALAMDCFIANRSSNGSLQAGTKSSQWVAFAVTGELPPGPCATAINNALTAARLPTVVATRTDKTLLASLPATQSWLLSNGKGVDHFEESVTAAAVMAVVEGVLSTDVCA
ncbi:MAG: hypothetical protein QOE80_1128 [Actinomycetota bacterium]|nr:hypothetical protein [Actinomycetota bacterium]